MAAKKMTITEYRSQRAHIQMMKDDIEAAEKDLAERKPNISADEIAKLGNELEKNISKALDEIASLCDELGCAYYFCFNEIDKGMSYRPKDARWVSSSEDCS